MKLEFLNRIHVVVGALILIFKADFNGLNVFLTISLQDPIFSWEEIGLPITKIKISYVIF